MKSIFRISPLALALSLTALYAPVSMADDNEVKKTEDTSTNPITGTETNTKKEEMKTTNADGSVSKMKKKKIVKKKKDGSMSRKSENESSTDQK